MRARKPENVKADREFSAKVLGRDGRTCKMQRWDGNGWREHGTKGYPHNPIDAAHIIGRPHLSPKTRYEPILGCSSCRSCHQKYDAHDDTVRVPPQRERDAWKFLERAQVLGKIKGLPKRRIPPDKPESA